MATANQEKTYNEFIKFYDLADKLIEKSQLCSEDYAKDQFDEIEKMVLYLEECADILTTDYIEIVKNSRNEEKSQEISLILQQIQLKTQECRKSLEDIYEKHNA